jgi:hypothetical protein
MENEQFQNFNCISNCIKNGVMMLVKKHIPILEHIHFEEQNDDAILAKEIVHESQIPVLNIYVAPHETLTSTLNIIETTLHHLHLNEIIIILGYFNIYMLQRN